MQMLQRGGHRVPESSIVRLVEGVNCFRIDKCLHFFVKFAPALCASALVHLLEHLERVGCVHRELIATPLSARTLNAFDSRPVTMATIVYWSLTPHFLIYMHAAFVTSMEKEMVKLEPKDE